MNILRVFATVILIGFGIVTLGVALIAALVIYAGGSYAEAEGKHSYEMRKKAEEAEKNQPKD